MADAERYLGAAADISGRVPCQWKEYELAGGLSFDSISDAAKSFAKIAATPLAIPAALAAIANMLAVSIPALAAGLAKLAAVSLAFKPELAIVGLIIAGVIALYGLIQKWKGPSKKDLKGLRDYLNSIMWHHTEMLGHLVRLLDNNPSDPVSPDTLFVSRVSHLSKQMNADGLVFALKWPKGLTSAWDIKRSSLESARAMVIQAIADITVGTINEDFLRALWEADVSKLEGRPPQVHFSGNREADILEGWKSDMVKVSGILGKAFEVESALTVIEIAETRRHTQEHCIVWLDPESPPNIQDPVILDKMDQGWRKVLASEQADVNVDPYAFTAWQLTRPERLGGKGPVISRAAWTTTDPDGRKTEHPAGLYWRASGWILPDGRTEAEYWTDVDAGKPSTWGELKYPEGAKASTAAVADITRVLSRTFPTPLPKLPRLSYESAEPEAALAKSLRDNDDAQKAMTARVEYAKRTNYAPILAAAAVAAGTYYIFKE